VECKSFSSAIQLFELDLTLSLNQGLDARTLIAISTCLGCSFEPSKVITSSSLLPLIVKVSPLIVQANILVLRSVFDHSYARTVNNGIAKAPESRSLRHWWCLCTFPNGLYPQYSRNTDCTQVLSPFQAITDFERKHGIPTDWINYAIRHSSPGGHWQRLERAEIKLNADFFKGFTADLYNKNAWRDFHMSFRNEKKKLKDTANPTQLGDHVSLKAEAADSEPTDQDRGALSADEPGQKPSTDAHETARPSLSKLAEDTTIGDPVSLESEDVVESSGKVTSKPDLTPEAKNLQSPRRHLTRPICPSHRYPR